ncbi:MAG: dipeptide epimerase [Bacteroidales bacterium]|jgi:L-alanine-DL-glutamate epimerase-like enolase superfamily enzyme|nr:dipeptide epimerase [Bacteroidales bacterium]
MTTRRNFIKQSGLTAGGFAAATALGASALPAGEVNGRKKEGLKSLKISKMIIEPINIEMEPFPIALGVMTKLDNALVTIVLENGIEGFGEAAPIMTISGENQQTILGTLNSCREFIVGQDINNYRSLAYTLKSAFWAQSTARCAIEMALLDAYTKTLNIPFYRFLGGTDNRVETDYTIAIVPALQAKKEAVELAAMGFRVIKTKVGINLKEDVERVLAIHDGAPDCGILIDANQGYSPKTALRFINEVVNHGIYPVMFEQPVHKNDLAGMKHVRDNTEILVGADESVFTRADAINIVRTGCADAINIKLMKSCIIEALDIAAVARSANLKLMIGCMVETNLALGCAVHFAAGVGGFEFIDLDPSFEASECPVKGGPVFKAPHWTIGPEPGLGFSSRQ